MSAAEIAGAQAGMTAAYAAYGYNFTGKGKEPYSTWWIRNFFILTKFCLSQPFLKAHTNEIF